MAYLPFKQAATQVSWFIHRRLPGEEAYRAENPLITETPIRFNRGYSHEVRWQSGARNVAR